jgi:hypothetical protein
MAGKIQSHRDLEVYRKAFAAAMQVFELSKKFPKEETYSLTDCVQTKLARCSRRMMRCSAWLLR